MQNEILKPVLDTDEVAVPRYDIVGPNGSVIQQNVELRLKNEVVQEGTPYDEESVLPASLREQLELPQSATPAEAFLRMLKVSGGAVSRNRTPQTSDAQPAGKIWIVPKMVFNNQMPNALTQVASNWKCTAATAAVSGNKVTVTGNGGAATLVAEATMLTAVEAADLLYVTADVTVLDDANSVTIELICDNNVVATQSLNVPTGGDTMQLVSRAPAGANAIPKLRVTSVYNTASAQSGKRVSVAAITVWNLTADMCQIEPELEFTQAEATAYLTQYGAFQTREYEWSMYWWVCRGVLSGQYQWQRFDDYANMRCDDLQSQLNATNSHLSEVEAKVDLNTATVYSLSDSLRRTLVANAFNSVAPPEASAMYVEPFMDFNHFNSIVGANVVAGKGLVYNTGEFTPSVTTSTSYGNDSARTSGVIWSPQPQVLKSLSLKLAYNSSYKGTYNLQVDIFKAATINLQGQGSTLTVGEKIATKTASLQWPTSSDDSNTFRSISIDVNLDRGFYILDIAQTSNNNAKINYYGSASLKDVYASPQILARLNGSDQLVTGSTYEIGWDSSNSRYATLCCTPVFAARTVSSGALVAKQVNMPFKASKALMYLELASDTLSKISLYINQIKATTVEQYNTVSADGRSCVFCKLMVDVANLQTLDWRVDLTGTGAIQIYDLAVFYI